MNELVLSEQQLMQFIGQYIWPMLRIGGLFLAMPVIGAQTITARVRVVLTFFTTILVAPMLPPPPAIDLVSMAAMVIVAKELLIGIAMGFMLQVFLQIFILSGELMAMKMGLGFAAMNDPSTGVSTSVLSQFYLLLATLLFLIVDGHLILIGMLIDSFNTLPIGGNGLGPGAFASIAGMGSWLFSSALVITLPVFTAIMVINMAFGAMNRSAPQMNVFTVGFPMTLIFGLLVMWLVLPAFLPAFELFTQEAFLIVRQVIGLP
ncbi:flagellar biosynthetic protein FliR [Marinimicrobium agarilyticum]|uniref:flagellar biosynthetic protein FliR n=1 Tax=Marinimicrobium agarilyticum TaxID=306546 RepID=UPI00041C6C5D|nr:flagellar biosynthetic protein FliR [Marinimicrobium agarilyticum]